MCDVHFSVPADIKLICTWNCHLLLSWHLSSVLELKRHVYDQPRDGWDTGHSDYFTTLRGLINQALKPRFNLLLTVSDGILYDNTIFCPYQQFLVISH